MKIAIVYHFFAHYRTPVIEELASSNNDFYFIADTVPSKVYSRLKLHEFSEEENFLKVKNYWFLKYFLWQKGLTKALKKNNFDAVVFLGDWKFMSTWNAVYALKKSKTPTYFWSHGMLRTEENFNAKMKSRFLGLFSHGGFVYSEGSKENMEKMGFDKPLHVIYNSLAYKKQNAIYTEIVSNNGVNTIFEDNYVILTGRLDKRKNIDILLEAAALLKKEQAKKINILLVGEGNHKNELEELANTLDISDQVHFYGSCYDENTLAQLYYNAFVCVIPDAVGLSAIHALTYRTPVITCDNFNAHGPEVEVVIDGKTGGYYKKDDVYSLANQVVTFYNATDSEKKKYENACIDMIKGKYNPEVQSQILNTVLENDQS